MKKTKVAVMVLNWNGLKLLKPFLNSLASQDIEFETVIVDNGSNDGSREFLLNRTGIPLHILLLSRNTGFAVGSNLAMSFARGFLDPDYYILLNNDTLLEPGSLKAMVKKAEEYGNKSKFSGKNFPFLGSNKWKTGSIAPLIENHFEKGKTDSAGILVYPDGSAINRGVGKDVISFKQDEEVFGPSGAAVLYFKEALLDTALPSRQSVVLKLGKAAGEAKVWKVKRSKDKNALPLQEFFSSRYFAYYEDVDLAYRLRLGGWGTVFTPKAKVYHHHSATGKSYSPFKSYHIHRNQYFNLIRDFPSHYLLSGLLRAVKRYFHLFSSIREKKGPAAVLAQKSSKLSAVWIVMKGWGSILANLPGLFRERWKIQTHRKISLKEFSEVISHKRFKASLYQMIYETPYLRGEQKKSGAKGKPPTS